MIDKTYQPNKFEDDIYKRWENGEYFTPKVVEGKKPFTVILPLPNANDPLHMGHALFTVEDIMVRYHRMLGDPTLWLPGADHAGIETQFVFEKYLGKEGKSRFDFDRNTLYKMVWEYVEKNREINKDQLKRLGFSLDWTRYHYSLEPKIIENVFKVFRKLHREGLIYRGERIVNFCIRCGTAFSEMEVDYQERDDFLYYLNYGTVAIATTRPETIFADVAVCVNPTDAKYKKLTGNAKIPIINIEIPIIKDAQVQKDFGTGALKITPGYDPVDFEIGQKNNLEIIGIMNRRGKMQFNHNRFTSLPQALKDKLNTISGANVKTARELTVALLEKEGTLIKKVPYKHSVGTCYRCGTVIEPMVIPQWFAKTKTLADRAIEAVKTGKTKIVPKKRFEKLYFDWLKNLKDWNISRQIVWGPRIPAWYCLSCNPEIEIGFITKNGETKFGTFSNLSKEFSFEEIKYGLQFLIADKTTPYQLHNDPCEKCQSNKILQETDTFDTWFLSGQWPANTLGVNIDDIDKSSADFKYFYPTSVLDTLWDILPFWVLRMMMLGLFVTNIVPFKVVHIHARVVDKLGKKMSKSKGNVINPLVMVDKYGADALRLALTMGVAPASDICLSEEKIIGMRNFCNKLWNISRFLLLNIEGKNIPFYTDKTQLNLKEDKEIIKKLKFLVKSVNKNMELYNFGRAAELLYQFAWHEFADKYLEASKERVRNGDLTTLSLQRHILLNLLKMLHPFIPFVTESIWSSLPKKEKTAIIVSAWPK